MKKKTVLLCAAVGVGLLLLWLLQALLVPKYMVSPKEGALVGEYYASAGDNDVIFIGDCEVYENFSPIAMYEEYGITSYIRGSAQQMIWQSYYLLEETLTYETPKVVVFNVLAMKYDTPESTGDSTQREAYNRMTLDTMRLSASKWNAILASMTQEERERDAQYSYLFPLLRYHDRWHQLTSEDFTYWLRRDTVSQNGYLMQTGVKPYTTAYAERPLADYSFGENSWYYLDKIAALCAENGIQLVLIKAPSMYPIWWDEWDAQIRQYAEENDLLYVNMLNYVEEIGIDWNTDTYDSGLHLNVYGAEKAASWLGQILDDQFNLPDRREDADIAQKWEEKISAYYAQKTALEESTEAS